MKILTAKGIEQIKDSTLDGPMAHKLAFTMPVLCLYYACTMLGDTCPAPPFILSNKMILSKRFKKETFKTWNLSTSVHTHVHVYAHAYVHVHAWTHAYMPAPRPDVQACIGKFLQMCMHMCTHGRMHNALVHTCARTCVRACAHICTCAGIACVHVRTCGHAENT